MAWHEPRRGAEEKGHAETPDDEELEALRAAASKRFPALAKAIYDQSQEGMNIVQKLRFRLKLERKRLGWWKFALKLLWPSVAAVTAVIAALSVDMRSSGTTIERSL